MVKDSGMKGRHQMNMIGLLVVLFDRSTDLWKSLNFAGVSTWLRKGQPGPRTTALADTSQLNIRSCFSGVLMRNTIYISTYIPSPILELHDTFYVLSFKLAGSS